MTGQPCIFFDRDGIVNEVPDPARYVVSLEKFHLIPAFLDALRVVNESGCAAVIATNQRGIATGHLSQAAVDEIHDHLRERVQGAGMKLTGIYVCPHDDNCHPWRKPNPGMLLEAARDHDLDLAASWMIGDHESDVMAGKRAGCRTIRVGSLDGVSEATCRVASMTDLAPLLRELLGAPG